MRDKRLHFVLVPGFGGFDALGQIQYYAGVTPVFRRWREGLITTETGTNGSSGEHKHVDKSNTTIHYFDNFPTACIRTRAQRLRTFLCERIARGEFSTEDRVVLIGHSTAGLDIRRLLCDLDIDAKDKASYITDGYVVSAKEVLDVIDQVVFMSVPQKGTNIACWSDWLWIFSKLSLADLRTSVEVSQILMLDQLEALVVEGLALSDIDVVLAVRDALSESRLKVGATSHDTAAAQEASAELALWLRHIFWDFSSIKDLVPSGSARRKHDDMALGSPAHFSDNVRNEEIEMWRNHDITTRSYATIAKSPFEGTVLGKFNPFALMNPGTYLRMLADAIDCKVDVTFAAGYQLCANGTFCEPDASAPRRTVNGTRPAEIIDQDNDGVVNTASMLWPHGDDTILVHADHMDIVGHYRRVPEKLRHGRRYQSYDLLKSESGFEETTFESVWSDVFNSCLVKEPNTPVVTSSRKRPAAVASAS